ncbi:hypothetical protein HMPREF9445_03239 [Bacteroides clarus YIT 12056]|uniref:Uncharacterized protein n=1 Tax=Bacteroides clarus YIT 12056 TaxID=762984 RepID=A0ABN0CL57_9BACE|nr:hypothetical protein HMPREF9445_03239 [Bacteroides clarus YIT 12056]
MINKIVYRIPRIHKSIKDTNVSESEFHTEEILTAVFKKGTVSKMKL